MRESGLTYFVVSKLSEVHVARSITESDEDETEHRARRHFKVTCSLAERACCVIL